MEPAIKKVEPVYFFSKFWWGLFLAAAVLISLVLLVVVFYPLGLSMASDSNFGLIAMISGIMADLLFRWILKKKMMISKKLSYSILYAWIPLCLYIIVFNPLE
ncbi:MAG: hypothetical protein RLO81_06370 [Fulvivirga sp.]|uniref:hypothetical protein n=1 Tax=Fulvivirga sp. TaxID=1931237 RepID=UPI0032EAE42E